MAERTAAPNYGIMYNWDGAPHGYSEYPQSLGAVPRQSVRALS